MRLFIGTYTEPILHGTGDIVPGGGKGIYRVQLDDQGQFSDLAVVAETANPSFLCVTASGEFLYAVNELKQFGGHAQGSISAFTADGVQLCVQPTGGADPCHVVLSRDGKLLVVSNFLSGSVIAYPVNTDGTLAGPGQVFQYQGKSVDATMQQGPHAHSATFDASGRYVYVPDLGTDQLHIYSYDPGQPGLAHHGDFATPPASGPRYCEFSPSSGLLYCMNQLSNTVDVMRPTTGGDLSFIGSYSTLPAGFTGESMGGTLRLTPDGGHLYASNRIHDSVAVFAVVPDGTLALTAVVPSDGETPRDFTITPDGHFLVVANQDSDNIVSFAISPDGALDKCDQITVPTPVCVVSA